MKRKKLNLNRDYYRDRCDEVVSFKQGEELFSHYEKIIDDLRDTLRGRKDIIALSAPQIGEKVRIFCMKFSNNDIRTFINPLIVERKHFVLAPETQIGFNDEFNQDSFFVPRYDEILVGYQTPAGNVEQNKFTGLASHVFEQMTQLLDGVFISDFGLPILDEWHQATDEEKEEIIANYFKWLDDKQAVLEEDLSKDEEFKKLTRLSEFYREAILGNIDFVKE